VEGEALSEPPCFGFGSDGTSPSSYFLQLEVGTEARMESRQLHAKQAAEIFMQTPLKEVSVGSFPYFGEVGAEPSFP